jgi:nucleoside-diphosphate-sugar epimerase
MKLLVVGAGYVGEALLKTLQDKPYEIFITTTKENRIPLLTPYGKPLLLVDFTKDLKELINACDGMVILVAPGPSQSYEETYLKTATRISSILENRQTPFYLLYTSSTSVCEGIESKWVTEDMALFPKSENAKILLETERYYLNCNASTCILRLGGIYGPKRDLIDRARRMSGKTMPGTGLEATNHIHVEDIVAAICFCLEKALTGIYHLVNDDHTTRKELYSSLCTSTGLPPPLWNSKIHLGSYKVSNEKIKKAGFIFKHPYLNCESQ